MCSTAPLLLLSVVVLAGVPKRAEAQADYPARAVKILVPYGAGGGTDVLARLFAKGLSDQLGRPFYIENRAGAATNIAAAAAARSAPDGYTLFVSTIASNALNKWSYKKLEYDPDAFAPVGMLGQNTFYLVVSASSPANSVQDLIRMAKERPQGLSYGSNGNGTPNQLLAELFKKHAGINLLHVPYKGSSESNVDLMAGRIDFMFDGSAIALVKTGRLKALAVAFPKRWPTEPSIATMGEAGYPDVTISTFFGLVAPPNTPPAILDKLNEAIRLVAANTPGLEEKMQGLGMIPFITTRQETADFLNEQSRKWGPVIRALGIEID
jgi:tripartite-type tricarboxylate transporter receptor subunit TctC